jgi:hypothetical protein
VLESAVKPIAIAWESASASTETSIGVSSEAEKFERDLGAVLVVMSAKG